MSNKVELIFTAKDLTHGAMKGLTKGFRGLSGKVEGLSNQLFSLKGLLAGVGIGAVAKQFVDAANTSEQLKTRLTVLLGSVSEGSRLFKEMGDFASKVPFKYEDIMNSATVLAGVLKGGTNEIKEWMPLIGDLAATTGLSIQETTEQVQRMLSAGAASADKFRERGVLAMMGFQAGTSYSVEQTRKMMVEAWKDPMSKFRGATSLLATTWSGTLSMISDKWFKLRNIVMDAGVLDYIKGLAQTINQYFGSALENNAGTAKVWANVIIDGIRWVMKAVGFVTDAFRGLEVVWAGLKTLFSAFAVSIVEGLLKVANGIREVANVIPWVDIGPFTTLENIVKSTGDSAKATRDAFDKLILEPMPSTVIEGFASDVEANFARIRKASTLAKAQEVEDQETVNTVKVELLTENVAESYGIFDESLLSQQERQQLHDAQELANLKKTHKSKAITDAQYIKQKEKLEQAHLKRMDKYNVTYLKGSFGFGEAMRKREYVSALTHAEGMLSMAKGLGGKMFKLWQAVALAKSIVSLPASIMKSFENGGGYPFGLIPAALMAARGALEIKKIRGASLPQAHAGLTNVPRDQTYLLKAGERVLAPQQNKDLTAAINGQGLGRGGVSVDTLNFNISVTGHELTTMDSSELQDLIADKFIPALDALSDQGIRQQDFSRMEQR